MINLSVEKQHRLVEQMIVRMLERAGMTVKTYDKPDGITLDVTFNAPTQEQLLAALEAAK